MGGGGGGGRDFWLAIIFFGLLPVQEFFLDCSPVHEFFFDKICFMHSLLLN